MLTGQELRKWLSPPDPSTNHNIACDSHNDGTATWFLRGSIFEEWKSKLTPSLLWIHGKRVLFFTLKAAYFTASCLTAGSGKSIMWLVVSRPNTT